MIVRGTAQLFVAGPPVVAAAAWARRPTRRSSAARACRRARARWTTSPPTRTTRSRSSGAFSRTCRTASGRRRRCSTATDPADRREEELVSMVPRDARQPYKMRRVLEAVLDRDSVFELGAAFGRPTITCLARLGGRPVGVLASDPEHYGGGVTADAAEKTARFVDMCDQFHLPVVNFVDVPGFVIGTAAERAGTIRRGSRGAVRDGAGHGSRGCPSSCARSTGWRAPGTATARGSTSASPGHRETGARCRWRAASRRPTGASSRRPRTRPPCARRSRRDWRLSLTVPHRRALQRRGDHRPSRHASDPVRLGGAGARAGAPRTARRAKDARPAAVI